MRNKTAMRREVRCLYCAVFKASGRQENIKEMVGWYDRYNAFRKEVLESESAPSTIKTQVVPIKTPQYIKWVKQYIIEEK